MSEESVKNSFKKGLYTDVRFFWWAKRDLKLHVRNER